MTAASPPPTETAPAPARRWLSLDAYRGWVMCLMMGEALQFYTVAGARPQSAFWRFLGQQQTHAKWTGCSLHDLIQPSFTFLVGVVLPFSLASRAARGQSARRMTCHALGRALFLILLGVLLRSISAGHVNWTFEDTLSQIGLGYVFLFFLGSRPARDHWIALITLLAGYWAAFALYPVPQNFDYSKVGVPDHWSYLMSGFAAHWNKNSNPAWAFDTWFLNLFPRQTPFLFNKGGYPTLSFIPTIATMILGLIAGNVLRAPGSPGSKFRWFVCAGAVCLALGLLAAHSGLCPIVKRIWTPSWVLFSGGWCFLYLAGFYAVIEMLGFRRWVFPLVVVGSNSIAAYCVANVSDPMLDRFSRTADALPPGPYATLWRGGIVLLILWLVLYALYRKKIFLRI
jgi:predicted acyltransferase